MFTSIAQLCTVGGGGEFLLTNLGRAIKQGAIVATHVHVELGIWPVDAAVVVARVPLGAA